MSEIQKRTWLRKALKKPNLSPEGRRRLQGALRRSLKNEVRPTRREFEHRRGQRRYESFKARSNWHRIARKLSAQRDKVAIAAKMLALKNAELQHKAAEKRERAAMWKIAGMRM